MASSASPEPCWSRHMILRSRPHDAARLPSTSPPAATRRVQGGRRLLGRRRPVLGHRPIRPDQRQGGSASGPLRRAHLRLTTRLSQPARASHGHRQFVMAPSASSPSATSASPRPGARAHRGGAYRPTGRSTPLAGASATWRSPHRHRRASAPPIVLARPSPCYGLVTLRHRHRHRNGWAWRRRRLANTGGSRQRRDPPSGNRLVIAATRSSMPVSPSGGLSRARQARPSPARSRSMARG